MTHYEIEYRRSNGDHTDTYGEIDGDKARSLAEGLAAGLLAASGAGVLPNRDRWEPVDGSGNP